MRFFAIVKDPLFLSLLIILIIIGDFFINYIPLDLMFVLILYFIIDFSFLFRKILQRDQIKFPLAKVVSFGIILIVGYGDLYLKLSRSYSHFFKNDRILTTIDSIYFSITTFTTTGYGDIYPISNTAKIFVASEMIFGYILGLLAIAILVIKFIDADE
ncbi:ion channel [Desulfosporosinus sp. FKB]|uniref:ion channel n=1 Tax=Desulfosporosinus sp. FKB TaxID=1969835 RepID=UPI000B49ECF0|nr:ion channel [Desulfosporosinus sp. FKB]